MAIPAAGSMTVYQTEKSSTGRLICEMFLNDQSIHVDKCNDQAVLYHQTISAQWLPFEMLTSHSATSHPRHFDHSPTIETEILQIEMIIFHGANTFGWYLTTRNRYCLSVNLAATVSNHAETPRRKRI